jgi:hypothetical protein
MRLLESESQSRHLAGIMITTDPDFTTYLLGERSLWLFDSFGYYIYGFLFQIVFELRLLHCTKNQCCRSGRFLTGSGSDFIKRSYPDPDIKKFAANFFLEVCLMKICSKKYIHGPKSLTTEILEVIMTFTHQKS